MLSTTRGAGIKEYLKSLGFIPNFVILDDKADMVGFLPYLVKTDLKVGLTIENVHQAINKLLGDN